MTTILVWLMEGVIVQQNVKGDPNIIFSVETFSIQLWRGSIKHLTTVMDHRHHPMKLNHLNVSSQHQFLHSAEEGKGKNQYQ